jgi:hypothetical protein
MADRARESEVSNEDRGLLRRERSVEDVQRGLVIEAE